MQGQNEDLCLAMYCKYPFGSMPWRYWLTDLHHQDLQQWQWSVTRHVWSNGTKQGKTITTEGVIKQHGRCSGQLPNQYPGVRQANGNSRSQIPTQSKVRGGVCHTREGLKSRLFGDFPKNRRIIMTEWLVLYRFITALCMGCESLDENGNTYKCGWEWPS